MSSTVGIEVIQECWTRIEPYLDIISLISVSKSCSKLRQPVVDDDSGKIKASILIVPYILDEDCPYGPISEHAPRLLNLVHFPSLVKLDINFPAHYGRVNENDFPLALPILARKLENAYNLESLSINVDSLIVFEDGGRPQVAYETIKNNLIHCINRTKNLRHLSINNSGGRNGNYSSAFFSAMVPVVKAGIACLEEIYLFCGGSPASPDYPDALHDFYEAFLSLQNLKSFSVSSSRGGDHSLLINSLSGVCQTIEKSLGQLPSKSLECAALMLLRGGECEQTPSVKHILSLLTKSNSLNCIMLWLPLSCWNCSNISDLIHYISKRSLQFESISVRLDGYKDRSGNLLSFIQKIDRGEFDFSANISRIGYIAEQNDSIEALGQHVKKKEVRGETVDWNFSRIKPDKKKNAKVSA